MPQNLFSPPFPLTLTTFYMLCKALGKLKYKAKKARLKIARKRLKSFIAAHGKRWLAKRKLIAAERIRGFLEFNYNYGETFDLKCHRYFMKVIRIQRNIKLFLFRRFITYASMDCQWTKAEKTLVKRKELKVVNKAKAGQIVSVHVRKIYFRKYMKSKIQQREICKPKKMNRDLEIDNKDSKLMEQLKSLYGLVENKPNHRPRAVDHILVPYPIMKEMVLEAIENWVDK